jgi:hypothetical protein
LNGERAFLYWVKKYKIPQRKRILFLLSPRGSAITRMIIKN